MPRRSLRSRAVHLLLALSVSMPAAIAVSMADPSPTAAATCKGPERSYTVNFRYDVQTYHTTTVWWHPVYYCSSTGQILSTTGAYVRRIYTAVTVQAKAVSSMSHGIDAATVERSIDYYTMWSDYSRVTTTGAGTVYRNYYPQKLFPYYSNMDVKIGCYRCSSSGVSSGYNIYLRFVQRTWAWRDYMGEPG